MSKKDGKKFEEGKKRIVTYEDAKNNLHLYKFSNAENILASLALQKLSDFLCEQWHDGSGVAWVSENKCILDLAFGKTVKAHCFSVPAFSAEIKIDSIDEDAEKIVIEIKAKNKTKKYALNLKLNHGYIQHETIYISGKTRTEEPCYIPKNEPDQKRRNEYKNRSYKKSYEKHEDFSPFFPIGDI